MADRITFRMSRRDPKFILIYIFAIFFFSLAAFIVFVKPAIIHPVAMNTITVLAISTGLVMVMSIEIKRVLTKYTLHGTVLLKSRGILHKKTLSINLSRVNDMKINQGLTHRLLGIANIDISTDTLSLYLRSIGNHEKVVQNMIDVIERGKVSSYPVEQRFPVENRKLVGVYR